MSRISLSEIQTRRITRLAPPVNVNRQSTTYSSGKSSRGHLRPVQVLTGASRREVDYFDNRLTRRQSEYWRKRHSHPSSTHDVCTLSECDSSGITAQTLNRVRDTGSSSGKEHRLSRRGENSVHEPVSVLNICHKTNRANKGVTVNTIIRIPSVRAKYCGCV